MGSERVDVAVVGAGPAGMAAAMRASALGLHVVVIDESPGAGGQYYRQRAMGRAKGRLWSYQERVGSALIARLQDAAELQLGTSVWNIERTRLSLEKGGSTSYVEAGAVVLATGAYDRPVAFPGWTKLGVVTAGGAQALTKGQRVMPGRRALVVGSGPLLLPVAVSLAKAGTQVLGVAEGLRRVDLIRAGKSLALRRRRWPEITRYLVELARYRIPVLSGVVVDRALGDEKLEGVVLRKQRSGQEFYFDVDMVCVGYGFSVATELAQLGGCEMVWDVTLRQFIPVVDAMQQSTTAGVFLAGEVCGLGGVRAAELEGDLAGLGAAMYLGGGNSVMMRRAAREVGARLRGERNFTRRLLAPFANTLDVLPQLEDDTIVCRCESVPYGAVTSAIGRGARSLNELKTSTRCGMGWCQGRVCGVVLRDVLRGCDGVGFDATSSFTVRPPVRPIPARAL